MKILFLSDDFPPKSFGGAGIITYNLALGLKKAGHELFVITTIQDKSLPRGWKDLDGMRVYDLYNDYDGRFAPYVSLYNRGTLKTIESIIQEIKPDVIHAHNIHNNLSYYSLVIARKYCEKVFLTMHDAMAFNYGKLIRFFDTQDLSVQTTFSYKVGFLQNIKTAKKRFNPFRNILIRYYVNKYSKKIFAISHRLKDALLENGITNVETIHYGIDFEDWTVTEEEKQKFAQKLGLYNKKIIFFGGRLSEAKGGRVMIDVLNDLVLKDKDILLLIAGTENDYATYLLQYAKELGIEKNIVFTGWLNRNDMKKAYAICDVVVTPSIYFDAFNLFNIEAGAASKPVVGTCFGGTPEIIQSGETGIIVNPLNIKMFSEALFSILQNKELAKKMGNAARERIQNYFSMQKFVTATLDWYQK